MLHVVLPILVASVIPFALTSAIKLRGFSREENHRTRLWQAQLQGWQQRANWAQQNAFETLPIFTGAVILAHLFAPGSVVAAIAAWIYPVLRIVYSVLYITDRARPRSVVWLVSLGAILALFGAALFGI